MVGFDRVQRTRGVFAPKLGEGRAPASLGGL